MAPKKEKSTTATSSAPFAIGDIVLGRIKGYPPWPAKVGCRFLSALAVWLHDVYIVRESSLVLPCAHEPMSTISYYAFHLCYPVLYTWGRRRMTNWFFCLFVDCWPREGIPYERSSPEQAKKGGSPCQVLHWWQLVSSRKSPWSKWPGTNSSWSPSGELKHLPKKEIDSYLSTHEKKGSKAQLLEAYRVASDPEKWEAEQRAKQEDVREQEEQNANGRDELESEDDVASGNKAGSKRKRGSGKPKEASTAKKAKTETKKKVCTAL